MKVKLADWNSEVTLLSEIKSKRLAENEQNVDLSNTLRRATAPVNRQMSHKGFSMEAGIDRYATIDEAFEDCTVNEQLLPKSSLSSKYVNVSSDLSKRLFAKDSYNLLTNMKYVSERTLVKMDKNSSQMIDLMGKYFADCSRFLSSHLRACSIPADQLPAPIVAITDVKLGGRTLLNLGSFVEEQISLICNFFVFQSTMEIFLEHLCNREQNLKRCLKVFESMEEENIILKDILSMHAPGAIRRTTNNMLSQLSKYIQQSREFVNLGERSYRVTQSRSTSNMLLHQTQQKEDSTSAVLVETAERSIPLSAILTSLEPEISEIVKKKIENLEQNEIVSDTQEIEVQATATSLNIATQVESNSSTDIYIQTEDTKRHKTTCVEQQTETHAKATDSQTHGECRIDQSIQTATDDRNVSPTNVADLYENELNVLKTKWENEKVELQVVFAEQIANQKNVADQEVRTLCEQLNNLKSKLEESNFSLCKAQEELKEKDECIEKLMKQIQDQTTQDEPKTQSSEGVSLTENEKDLLDDIVKLRDELEKLQETYEAEKNYLEEKLNQMNVQYNQCKDLVAEREQDVIFEKERCADALSSIEKLKEAHAEEIKTAEQISAEFKQKYERGCHTIEFLKSDISGFQAELGKKVEEIASLQALNEERSQHINLLMRFPVDLTNISNQPIATDLEDNEVQGLISLNNIRIAVLEAKNKELREKRLERVAQVIAGTDSTNISSRRVMSALPLSKRDQFTDTNDSADKKVRPKSAAPISLIRTDSSSSEDNMSGDKSAEQNYIVHRYVNSKRVISSGSNSPDPTIMFGVPAPITTSQQSHRGRIVSATSVRFAQDKEVWETAIFGKERIKQTLSDAVPADQQIIRKSGTRLASAPTKRVGMAPVKSILRIKSSDGRQRLY